MEILAAAAGLFVLVVVLIDAFETVILPRRVSGRFRLTRIFYKLVWTPWAAIARRIRNKKRRESFLSVFGPLSLLVLLLVWAVGLIVSFALLRWAVTDDFPKASLTTQIYISGISFVTLQETPSLSSIVRTLT